MSPQVADANACAQQATTALARFVTSVGHLPMFPGMAAQLIRSVEKEDISGLELSRQIAGDAALAGRLLRLVNSSFYGLSRRIGTVTDALAVLGFNTVRRIVMSELMLQRVQAHLPDSAATSEFWRHQLLTAALTRFMHQRSGADGVEVAYMAGLLHDIGRLAMFVRWPLAYGVFLQRPIAEDDMLLVDERQQFGFDHAQAGGALLRLWNVPESIALATEVHADETSPIDPVAASVWHANRLAHSLATEVDDGRDAVWMKASGLSVAARRQIIDEVNVLAGTHGRPTASHQPCR